MRINIGGAQKSIYDVQYPGISSECMAKVAENGKMYRITTSYSSAISDRIIAILVSLSLGGEDLSNGVSHDPMGRRFLRLPNSRAPRTPPDIRHNIFRLRFRDSWIRLFDVPRLYQQLISSGNEEPSKQIM
jgi:hypothetical protein